MATFTNKDLKQTIRDSLGVDDTDKSSKITEAFVANKKQQRLPTEMLSEKNKTNHIELYKGYVDSFNRISAELDAADRSNASSNSSQFRSLKIDETYNLNGVYLHELYFANISDVHSEVAMDSLSYIKLSRDFGTFDAWQRDFIACCQSSRCGWAITGYHIYLQSYVNIFVDLHSANVPVGVYPVIVMDVWQHAYYRDYLKDVKTYTHAMMKELNWNVIESRFKKAERISEAIRD
tara:strand:+ start:11253 stop:11957 length:705 start_codon:yes stop_codon:yes gene_type:complete